MNDQKLSNGTGEFRTARFDLSTATSQVRARTLVYLLDQAKRDAQDLPAEAIAALKERLATIPQERLKLPQTHEVLQARKQAFLAAHGINHHGGDTVETNPRGIPRESFLREADELARDLYGVNLLHRNEFATWVKPLNLDAPTSPDAPPLIVGPSTREIRNNVEVRIFNGTSVADLLVTHASFLVLTGGDLFEGKRGQAVDGTLWHFDFGLTLLPNRDT